MYAILKRANVTAFQEPHVVLRKSNCRGVINLTAMRCKYYYCASFTLEHVEHKVLISGKNTTHQHCYSHSTFTIKCTKE